VVKTPSKSKKRNLICSASCERVGWRGSLSTLRTLAKLNAMPLRRLHQADGDRPVNRRDPACYEGNRPTPCWCCARRLPISCGRATWAQTPTFSTLRGRWRGAALLQLIEIAEPRLQLTQLGIVEAARLLLAIAGDQGNRGTCPEQRHHGPAPA